MLILFNQLKQSEPKATHPQLDLNMTEENQELLTLLHGHNDKKDIDTDAHFNFGENYEWSSQIKVRTTKKYSIFGTNNSQNYSASFTVPNNAAQRMFLDSGTCTQLSYSNIVSTIDQTTNQN